MDRVNIVELLLEIREKLAKIEVKQDEQCRNIQKLTEKNYVKQIGMVDFE